MAYNQFTLQKVLTDFGLILGSVRNLFPGVRPVPVPDRLHGILPDHIELAVSAGTEAARSQLLVAPFLVEAWRAAAGTLALFIGNRFDVDEAAGLNGVCDYILGRPPQAHIVNRPVLMIVEAKNEDVLGGLGQCAAAMVAAKRFNEARGEDAGDLYGAVSDGERWRYLRLRGATLDMERADRLISDPDQIFGILLHICGVTPAAPAAA